MTYRNKKLLQLAKDCPTCMFCGKPNDGTIVACHRNEGKAMGKKVTDAWIAYGCYDCHHELDNGKDMTREERRVKWLMAYAETMKWLIENKHLNNQMFLSRQV